MSESNATQEEAAQAPSYFNRELSWLAFNRRVLEQAMDDRYPLLERMRFISFVSSNLDEFYEIRVSGIMQQIKSGVVEVGIDSLGPKEELDLILQETDRLVADQYACWSQQLVPSLSAKGISFKSIEELTAPEKNWLKVYFEEQVFPVLTPLAFDPAHPFPQLPNKGLNLLLWIDNPSTPEVEKMMALIPVPRSLPRIVKIENGKGRKQHSYVFLSDIIKLNMRHLFPGYLVKDAWAFRITRNSDLYIDEEEVENLLQTIEEELYNLQKGAAVRLEIEAGCDPLLLNELIEQAKLPPKSIHHIKGPLNLFRLMGAQSLIDRPELCFKPHVPYLPPSLNSEGASIFDAIRKDDILLHHPYDSFQPIVDFLEEAAHDKEVLAIKMTLYRTSSDSPIVKALMEASRLGKQVTVLVELKARFDEEQNIRWARQLESFGVHVVWGIVGMKTHCKCALVVRREGRLLRRYAHLGTGNYNPNTGRLYTDTSLFTATPELTSEVAEVFNSLTGFSRAPNFKELWVAPFNLHAGVQRMILREAANAKKGLPARIIAKCNSLVDKETIDNLYAASRAGVKIDLVIRGICCLVPGVTGQSENIRVISILGRYLEHSRIFYFENHGNEPEVLMGSADWMPRNFFRRIEVIFPLKKASLREQVVKGILEPTLLDTAFAKQLQPDGSYLPVPVEEGIEPFSIQQHLLAEAETRRIELSGKSAD